MENIGQKIREQFAKGDDIRDAGLTTPDDIQRFDDICYGTDTKWEMLDVYRPKNLDGKLPVIVSVHGGGWVYGDKERYQYYCMHLAQYGFAVVNFTYKLAPEFQFPANIEDVNLAFKWVLAHGDEYGFDLNNVFAVGDSAGGHLLSLFTVLCTNPEYAASYPFAVPEGFCPKAIGLHCGSTFLERGGRPTGSTNSIMEVLLPGHGTDEELHHITPVHYVTSNYPPVFLMTCSGDFLQGDALKMSKALVEHKVPFQFHYYGDQNHILGHVFHLNIRSKDAQQCIDETIAFFRQNMA